MNKKIRILKLPNSNTSMFRGGGMFGPQTPPTDKFKTGQNYGIHTDIKVRRTIGPTEKENATLEAEKGETVVTNLQHEGIPEFYIIGGKPHSRGGTPLNLPSNSFIFSKDSSLKIKDPKVLALFGKTGKDAKKGLVPAEISKQYNLNKYRKILLDPSSSKLQIKTAEMMIRNYNNKLGALALAQESLKGFDRGIPAISLPYMENVGLHPEDILTPPAVSEDLKQFRKGGQINNKNKGTNNRSQDKRSKGKRRVRIMMLPQYKTAGEYDKTKSTQTTNTGFQLSSRSTKKQYLPSNAVGWDPTKEGYDESKVKPGHYIIKNGSWYKVTGRTKKKFDGKLIDDPNLGKYQESYSMLIDKFNDPKVRKAFIDQYRKEIAAAKPNRYLSQKDIDEAVSMSDDEVINTFLSKLRTNLAINNKYGNLSEMEKKELWDKNPNIANQTAQELGYKPFNKAQVAAFQAGYIGFNNLSKDKKYKDIVKDFGVFQVGVGDEQINGVGKGTISQIDGWDGNTTSGQVILPTDSELELKEVEWDEEEPVDHVKPARAETPALPWRQDVLTVADDAYNYFTEKKYDPWTAIPEFTTYDPQFVDFRGAAARIGSQAQGLANASAQFSGPQAQAAMHANLQRGMVNPILQMQEMEARTNIGAANQASMFNAQQKNQYNQMVSGLQTQQYDKQVMANQLFDNAKRALRKNMLESYKNLLTNRGLTQTMNLMTPNYNVDPWSGGLTYFTRSDERIRPNNDNKTLYSDQAAELIGQYPDLDWPTAVKLVKLNAGYPVTDDELPEELNVSDIANLGYPNR